MRYYGKTAISDFYIIKIKWQWFLLSRVICYFYKDYFRRTVTVRILSLKLKIEKEINSRAHFLGYKNEKNSFLSTETVDIIVMIKLT